MSQTITQHSPNASTSTTPQRIRRIQNPIVGKSNNVILTNRYARRSAFWCMVNVIGALAAYFGL